MNSDEVTINLSAHIILKKIVFSWTEHSGYLFVWCAIMIIITGTGNSPILFCCSNRSKMICLHDYPRFSYIVPSESSHKHKFIFILNHHWQSETLYIRCYLHRLWHAWHLAGAGVSELCCPFILSVLTVLTVQQRASFQKFDWILKFRNWVDRR